MDQESSGLVELLLSRCLARLDKEGPEVVAEVCMGHENLIPEVQRLLDILAGLGFHRDDTSTPGEGALRSANMNGNQETLGDFRLIRVLGKGGMGAVYLAEDQELNRKVALKVIRSEFLQEEKAHSRFKRETDALARLDHPGLCTIYRAGEDDGLPWISMRYVEGETLDRVLARRKKAKTSGEEGGETSGAASGVSRRGRRDLSEHLVLFEKLALSLQSAHEGGLVHRDLKPGNLMITPDGEPVVLDFGLARDDTSDQHLTLSGEQLGTPAYMSPEQVRGGEIDARSDIYSLAVTLFETLTLELPYESRSREGLFQAIIQGERRRVSQVCRGYSSELQIVVDKAMDPDPARRYTSMKAFAEDLCCLRKHRPIHARRSSAHLRLRRWSQRNPVAATFLILMSLGLGTSLYLLERGNKALQRSYARGYANLSVSLREDMPLHAVELARRSVEMEDDPESYGRLDEALQDAHQAAVYYPETPIQENHEVKSILRSPALDEDRFLLLTLGHAYYSLDPILFTEGQSKRLKTPEGRVYDADWADDGLHFVTTSTGPIARIWSKSGVQLEEIRIPGTRKPVRVAIARFFPDGDRLLFSCNDGILRIWSRSRKKWLRQYTSRLCAPRGKRRNPLPIPALDLDPSGSFCVLGSSTQGVEYVDLVTGKSIIFQRAESVTGMEPSKSRVMEITISSDGRSVCAQWRNGILALWTVQGTLLHAWGFDGDQSMGRFSPDGRRFLTLHLSKVARLWNLGQKGKPKLDLKGILTGHQGWVTSGCFSPDGRKIMTGTANGVAQLWDAETSLWQARFSGSSKMVRAISFDRNGRSCVLGGDEGQVRRFQFQNSELPILRGRAAGVRSAIELPADWVGKFVTLTADSNLNFHSADGNHLKSIRTDISIGGSLALSPDGRWIAYSTSAGSVVVLAPPCRVVTRFQSGITSPQLLFGPRGYLYCYDYPQKEEQKKLLYTLSTDETWVKAKADISRSHMAHLGTFRTLAFHEQSQLLAVASMKAKIDIYACGGENLRHIRSIDAGGLLNFRIAFSSDGQRILCGATDTTAQLWSVEGKLLATLPGHAGFIASTAFSSDGSLMLTAAPRTGVRIWDREGRHLLSLRPRRGSLTGACFLSDGKRVLISSTYGTARVAWARPDLLLREASKIENTVTPQLWADYDRLVGK